MLIFFHNHFDILEPFEGNIHIEIKIVEFCIFAIIITSVSNLKDIHFRAELLFPCFCADSIFSLWLSLSLRYCSRLGQSKAISIIATISGIYARTNLQISLVKISPSYRLYSPANIAAVPTENFYKIRASKSVDRRIL